MKYILIAAVALLALAQGSFAQEATDLEKLTQYFETMKTQLTEFINNHQLADQAQSFLSERSAAMEPTVTQIKEQLRATFASAQDQIRPLAENVQAQAQPMMDEFQSQVQELLNRFMDQTQALRN
ncbi:type-4 ice-structuring protein-like [Cheilinus undulatus]|uniref:type-4 ice-structuring protein-like n=1 Tax=Cheilinus undulatus TaxID=241271 RepID=UPI001BD68434|nr:type-4 ice-structuring protein-like [Cheilinus undulatus]